MRRVRIRDLRQNLGVYMRRMKRGESLVPPSTGDEWLDRMVAEGKIIPGKGNLSDLPPPLKLPPGAKPLSEILQEMRDSERY